MSIELTKSLVGVSLGQTVTLDFRNQTTGVYIPPTYNQSSQGILPQLLLWNESGCGFDIQLPDRPPTKFLPAGGWRKVTMPADVQTLNLICTYVIANAPVSVLKAEFYQAGEPLDDIGFLGNSPVGVGGTIAVTSATSIKQDGTGAGTSLIESTPNDQASSSFALNNDGSGFWKILSAGNVLKNVINVTRGNFSTKSFTQIGDTSDITITNLSATLSRLSTDTNNTQTNGTTGAFIGVAGQTTVGQMGVPGVLQAPLRTHITATGATTVLSFTPSNTGLYRISGFLRLNNGTSGNNVSIILNIFDPDKVGGTNDTTALVGTNLNGASFFFTSGTSKINAPYFLFSEAFMHTGGQTISVTYNDPTNTPNDFISLAVELVA